MLQFRRPSSTESTFFPNDHGSLDGGDGKTFGLPPIKVGTCSRATVNKRLGDYGADSTFDLTENFVNTADR